MEIIREFVHERDWEKYHKPASLAVSTSIEAAELLELFQWLTDEEVENYLVNPQFRMKLSDEIADVLIYLLRLADVVDIDPAKAVLEKLKSNADRYPAEKWKGKIPNKTKNPR
ncbi:MAG: nucleotide pyrophosphohydrolase [Candidatus Thorarchaeota archaeon]|nr:nucleotide pyrophosphohydrolase [Candidatus Thorarchaeota archaeon]